MKHIYRILLGIFFLLGQGYWVQGQFDSTTLSPWFDAIRQGNAPPQYESASESLRDALQVLNQLEKQQDTSLLFEAYFQLGQIFQREKIDRKALEYFRKAAQYPPKFSSLEQLYQRFGESYFSVGQPDSALYFYHQALKLKSVRDNPVSCVHIYENIVAVFNSEEIHEKAIEYNQKIIPLLDKDDHRKRAIIFNNLGYDFNNLEEYREAIDYFSQALELIPSDEDPLQYQLLTNIGIAYQNIGQSDRAILFLQRAIRATPRRANKELSSLYNLISTIYLLNGDLYNSLQYNEQARSQARRSNELAELSEAYATAAQIHQRLYEYEEALIFFEKSLELRDSLRVEERLRQQELLQQQLLLERAEKEIKLLLVNQEIKDLTIGQLELEKQKLELEAKRQSDELSIMKQNQEIEQAEMRNQLLEAERNQQALDLAQQSILAEQRRRAILQLEQQRKDRLLEIANQQLELAEQEAIRQKQEQENTQLKQQSEIDQLQLDKEANFRQFVYGLGALFVLIMLMILSGLFYFRKSSRQLSLQNQQIEAQKVELEEQRNQSDRLLLNILPEETAKELKQRGTATARRYELVSVLFTDFSGFTRISAGMEPEELIEELNTCFRAFDEIIERHGLEKIKTIGDAYMCAGGIPQPNTSNPVDAVRAGMEMHRFMKKRHQVMIEAGKPYWKMRIGLHTGPIIAGVVGKKKFAYDIWGDTVNTAARLEQNGAESRINISQNTFQLIRDEFECTHRGEVEVKHGRKIQMYFVGNGVE